MGQHKQEHSLVRGVAVEDTKDGAFSDPYITYGITCETINNLSKQYLPEYATLTTLGYSCSFSQGRDLYKENVTAFGYWAKSSDPTDKLEDDWSFNGINHADEDTNFTVITAPFINGTYNEAGQITKIQAYQYVFKLEITSGFTIHKLKIANPKLLWYYDVPEYNIIFASQGEGKILGAESGKYEHNTKLTITAEPAKGYIFVCWLDDLTNTNPTREITITNEATYTAYFAPINKIYVGTNLIKTLNSKIKKAYIGKSTLVYFKSPEIISDSEELIVDWQIIQAYEFRIDDIEEKIEECKSGKNNYKITSDIEFTVEFNHTFDDATYSAFLLLPTNGSYKTEHSIEGKNVLKVSFGEEEIPEYIILRYENPNKDFKYGEGHFSWDYTYEI